ncbi:leukotriene-B4 omega-hydroxylase 3 [Ciona intestinalis]
MIYGWSSVKGFVMPTLIADLVLLFVLYRLGKAVVRNWKTIAAGRRMSKIIGSPPAQWIVGHAYSLAPTPEGLLSNVKTAASYPGMMVLWLAHKWIVQVYHPDTVGKVLSTQATKDDMTYEYLKAWVGYGVLTSNGKRFQRQKKLLVTAFHQDLIKQYSPVFTKATDRLIEKWSEKQNQSVELFEDISLLTLDCILICAMSTDLDCQRIGKQHPYIDAVHQLAYLAIKRFYNPWVRHDFIYNLTAEGRLWKKLLKVVHEMSESVVKARRKVVSISDKPKLSKTKYVDFLDVLLRTKDESGEGLTDQEIREQVDTFLFAGHDTTASAICWFLYNLACHPEYQDKCREEVKEVMEGRKDVQMFDIGDMTYLNMCLKESMRLHSPIPFIGRKVKNPINLRRPNDNTEVTLCPGTTIIPHLLSLHRNPDVWDEPEVYDPERFNTKNASRLHPYAYVPFSAGPRICIGQNFALVEMKLTVAKLLLDYEFYVDEDIPKPQPIPNVVLRSQNGLYVKFRKI